MPFTVQCSSCQSKFALPDSAYEQRIAGKVVDLACKHCRKNIRIDGTKPRSDVPSFGTSETARPPMTGAGVSVLPSRRVEAADAALNFRARGGSGQEPAGEALRTPAVQATPLAELGSSTSAAHRAAIRVPLPKASLSRAPGPGPASPVALGRARSLEPVSTPTAPVSLEPEGIEPDDEDRPTAILDRANVMAAAPKPPPRRSPGLKATMMGVAPPPNARAKAPPPPLRQPSPAPDAAASALRALGSAPEVGPLPIAQKVALPSPAVGGTRAKLGGGTMLGLAPPPAPAAPGSDTGGARRAAQMLAPDQPHTVSDPAVAAVSLAATQLATPAPEVHEPGELSTAPSPATDPAVDEAEFGDDVATRVDNHIDLEQQALPDAPARVELPPAALAPQVHAPVATSDEPSTLGDVVPNAEWESATSDVSRQIAQAVPNIAPKRRPGRWLLAALVAVVGGVAGVGFLVIDGRVKLPPAVQQLAARYVPALEPPSAAANSETMRGAEDPAVADSDAREQPTEVVNGAVADGNSEPGNAEPSAAEPSDAVPSAVAIDEAEPLAKAAVVEDDGATKAGSNAPRQPEADEVEKAAEAVAEPAAVDPAAEDSPNPLTDVEVPTGMQLRLAQPVSELPQGVTLSSVQYRARLRMLRAEKCHQGGRATGNATVMITFGPKGAVTDAAVIGEPIASAPVSNCLLLYARSIVVPEFEGAPFTVAYPITLR